MKICVGNALEKVIQKYFGGQPRGGAPSALDGHKRDFQPSKLNPSKSEFLWCFTLRRRHLLDGSTFALADADRSPPSRRHPQPRSLFGSCMTRTAHVSQLVRGCFYQLRRIKTIRKFIPTLTAVVLINSFIVSRVDYCNSLLEGLPICQLERIQSVLNSASRLIYGRTTSDHVTDLQPAACETTYTSCVSPPTSCA